MASWTDDPVVNTGGLSDEQLGQFYPKFNAEVNDDVILNARMKPEDPSYFNDAMFMFKEHWLDTAKGIGQLGGIDALHNEEEQAELNKRRDRLWDEGGWDMRAYAIAGYFLDPAMLMMPWARITQAIRAGKYVKSAIFGTTAGGAEGYLGYDRPDDDLSRTDQALLGAGVGSVLGPAMTKAGDLYRPVADKFVSKLGTPEGIGTVAGMGTGAVTSAVNMDNDDWEDDWQNWLKVMGAGAAAGAVGRYTMKLPSATPGKTLGDKFGKAFIPNYGKSQEQVMYETLTKYGHHGSELSERGSRLAQKIGAMPADSQKLFRDLIGDVESGKLRAQVMRDLDDDAWARVDSWYEKEKDLRRVSDTEVDKEYVRQLKKTIESDEWRDKVLKIADEAAEAEAAALKGGKRKGRKSKEYAEALAKQYQAQLLDVGIEAVRFGLLDPRKYRSNQVNYLAQKYRRNDPMNAMIQEARINGFASVFGEFMELGKRVHLNRNPEAGQYVDEFERLIKNKEGFDVVKEDGSVVRVNNIADYGKALPDTDVGRDINQLVAKGYDPEAAYAKLDFFYNVDSDDIADAIYRRPFSAEERAAMGEITDLQYLIDGTFRMYSHMLPKFQALDKMTKMGRSLDGPKITSSKSTNQAERERRGHTVKVPNNAKQWGPMSGQYVSPDTWQDLKWTMETNLLNRIRQEPLIRQYRKLNQVWKKAKTVWNPATHMNNTVSNIILYNFGDGSPIALAKAPGRLMKRDEMYREAARRGVFGGHASSDNTVKDNYFPTFGKHAASGKPTDAINAAMDNTGRFLRWTQKQRDKVKGSKTVRSFKWVDDKLQKVYGNEDNVFRMAMFETKVTDIRRANPSMSDDEVFDQAGKFARKFFVDYETTTPALEIMKDTFFPFASYTYGMIPNLIELAIKNPMKFMKWGAGVNLLNEITMDMSDADRDTLIRMRGQITDDRRKAWWGLPVGAPNMLKIPSDWTEGDIEMYLNLSRSIPGGDIFSTASADKMGRIPFLPEVAQPGGLALSVYDILRGIDSFSGTRIPRGEILKALYRQMTPNIGMPLPKGVSEWTRETIGYPFDRIGVPNSWAMDKLKRAQSGMVSPTRDQFTPTQAALSNIGIKVTPVEEHKNIRRINVQKSNEIRDLDVMKNKAKADYLSGQITQDQYAKKIEEYNMEKQRITMKYNRAMSGDW